MVVVVVVSVVVVVVVAGVVVVVGSGVVVVAVSSIGATVVVCLRSFLRRLDGTFGMNAVVVSAAVLVVVCAASEVIATSSEEEGCGVLNGTVVSDQIAVVVSATVALSKAAVGAAKFNSCKNA